MSSGLHRVVQLLLATRAAGLTTSTSLKVTRGCARSELLELLRPSASVAPLPVTGRVAELVDELELQGMVPATPAFLAAAANGRWQLRALLGPDGLELPAAGLPLAGVGLGVSEQHFELDPMTRAGGLCGRLVSSTDFTLRESEAEPLAGRLQSEADVYLTDHANTLHLKAAAHNLELPRLPSAPIEALIGALHSQLSAEFRTDEGMRVSLQTMYLDERVHISRCTTRGLAGLCAVHVRPEATSS